MNAKEFLNNVSKEIKYKPANKPITEELESHIEEAKKRYVPLTVIGEDYPSSSDVFSEISSYELEKYILDFIKMQKNEVQMIIYLDYEKKLSLHEIADVMGETEGAVKMKLYRFRKKLKQYLINEGFV